MSTPVNCSIATIRLRVGLHVRVFGQRLGYGAPFLSDHIYLPVPGDLTDPGRDLGAMRIELLGFAPHRQHHLPVDLLCLAGPDPTAQDQGFEPRREVIEQSIESSFVMTVADGQHPLRLLDRPTARETALRLAMQVQDKEMILRREARQMPKRRAIWSSGVCKADIKRRETAIGVTRWMNRLQSIPERDPLFVSLNPSEPVRAELICGQKTLRHPVFDTAALAAQRQLRAIQGENNTWYAGAYTRHGFHEDGFASAVRIARAPEHSYA